MVSQLVGTVFAAVPFYFTSRLKIDWRLGFVRPWKKWKLRGPGRSRSFVGLEEVEASCPERTWLFFPLKPGSAHSQCPMPPSPLPNSSPPSSGDDPPPNAKDAPPDPKDPPSDAMEPRQLRPRLAATSTTQPAPKKPRSFVTVQLSPRKPKSRATVKRSSKPKSRSRRAGRGRGSPEEAGKRVCDLRGHLGSQSKPAK
jgi:hypothetical protein